MILRRLLACALLAPVCVASRAGAAADQDYHEIRWKLRRDVRSVHRVFCHQTIPQVAWLSTTDGLLVTEDDGQTFQPVESATRDKVGLVTAIACCPAAEDLLAMGTDSRGLLLSRDRGQTWKPLGSENQPLASAYVAFVRFCTADLSFRTLRVTHGVAAPGMSITRDLGRTWDVIGTEQYMANFVENGETIIAAGSLVSTEGRIWGILRSGDDGLRWEEARRGIRPSDPARTRNRWRFLFATRDGSILESDNDGRTWTPLLESERSAWVSMFFTYGRRAGVELLAAYDPRRQGLALSTRNFRHGGIERRNKGLYVGPFVKSGAVCRANANGSTYYIVMNNSLWVGKRPPPQAGPVVEQAWCSPSTVWVGKAELTESESRMHSSIQAIAAGRVSGRNVRAIAAAARTVRQRIAAMGFRVLAKVTHPKGPAAVKTVTVDLSAFGQSRSAPLHDDGKHGDGKAGDGTFATDVSFSLEVFGDARGRRYRFPGRGAMTVTATDNAAKSDSWTVVASIQRQPGRLYLYGPGIGCRGQSVGPVAVHHARGEGLGSTGNALCFAATGPGPWRGTALTIGGTSITGRDTVDFYIKGDVNQEILFHIVDRFLIGRDVFDEPHHSRGVPLIAGGYLKAITPRYQKVSIPISELIPEGLLFLRHHTSGLALSVGEGGKPGRYCLDLVTVEP